MPAFLLLSWALTFGYLPSSTLAVQDTDKQHFVDQSGALMQTIELGLTAWDTITVWTNIQTYDTMVTGIRYAPFRSDYNIGLNVGHDVAGFRLDAGIKHECVHPVISGPVSSRRYAAGETEVYVKVSGSIGGER